MAAPKLTLVDRVVAWINPVAGIQRAHACTVLTYYEAAKPDRTREGRRAVGTAPPTTRCCRPAPRCARLRATWSRTTTWRCACSTRWWPT